MVSTIEILRLAKFFSFAHPPPPCPTDLAVVTPAMSKPPSSKKSRTTGREIPIPATEDDFKTAGGEIMKRDPEGRSEKVFERRWVSFFGVKVAVCVDVWDRMEIMIDDADLNGAKPCHLLWSLLFLKKYGDEEEMASLCGPDKAIDEKTFRKLVHLFVERISCLVFEVVSNPICAVVPIVNIHTNAKPSHFAMQIIWENRKKGDIQNDCLVSVDGTDCHVLRQKGEPKSWNSHKFKGPGVRYEIAICILTGDIVWVMGPFPCGDWPDINIFRFALKHMLDDGERVEADDGYVGDDPVSVKVPGSMVHPQEDRMLCVRTIVRRRHETANKRIKQFKSVDVPFRHSVLFHGQCFSACTVLTQLVINNGVPLFPVEGYIDPS